jgi:hypothetical protein
VGRICAHLHAPDVARLGAVCTALRRAEVDFRHTGHVVPLYPTFDLEASDPQCVYDIDAARRSITKNARRGMSHVVCRQVRARSRSGVKNAYRYQAGT